MTSFEDLRVSVGAAHVKSPVDDLGQHRFLFVTGKGGVGKTTVSASMYLSPASRILKALSPSRPNSI